MFSVASRRASMDFAAVGAVGSETVEVGTMPQLYWKIGVFASGNPKWNIQIVNPCDIRTYGDSESDNLWGWGLRLPPAGTRAAPAH
jgi:hypothetical protein